MSMFSVDGKVAIVSGSARGIGRATALGLAEQGANVLVNYRANEAAAAEVVERIRAMGREATAVQGDVSQAAAVDDLVQTALDRWGRIDILVSNAGAGTRLGIAETDDEEWERAIRLNIKSYFNLARAVMPHMMTKRSGTIVGVSSITGKTGKAFLAQSATYAGVKAAIVGYTRGLAREAAPYGITVNCVRPGWTDTDATAKAPAEIRAKALTEIPLGRTGTPEEVAGAIVFLASPAARYMTGQVLDVNGGLFIG
jgi:3-oxoacyl-[acyl-carrier protein] reductase